MQQAIVIGAGGGIGRACVDHLVRSRRYGLVHALSRAPDPDSLAGVRSGSIDIADPASIAAAAEAIAGDVDLMIVATGLLHEGGRGPERSLGALDPDWLLRQYQVNTIGPALVLKHFVPKLARDRRSVIACLSARVGSISDNRLGGWYGYRASKAALNQMVRTAAIEIARTCARAVCVAIHPGTVETGLSSPFRARVPPDRLFSPAVAAGHLLAVLDGLQPADSGGIFAWDGSPIAP